MRPREEQLAEATTGPGSSQERPTWGATDLLFHQVAVSRQVNTQGWGERRQISPQAGETAAADSSLRRPGVSCATTADERQSKMKCILPDVNTANCRSPQGNHSSRRKRKVKKMISLTETLGKVGAERGATGLNCGALQPAQSLWGLLVSETGKD